MIKAILKGILKMLSKVLNIFLLPVNALLENVFPDMTNAIATFNNFVTNVIGTKLAYFFNILPPTFKSLLVLWFTFVIAYYTVYYTYLGIIKIWAVIQKVKFW